MRTLIQLSFIALTSLVLISCSTGKCRVQGNCWEENFRKGSCGTEIQQRCEIICRECKFNDASCQACWKCADHDTLCEVDHPQKKSPVAIK